MAGKSTEVATVSTHGASVSLADGYTSIKATDVESRKVIFNAVSNADAMTDHLEKPFQAVGIIAQPALSEPDEKTGEVTPYTRTTFLLADGSAISSGSDALVSAVETVFAVFGEPESWPEGGLTMQIGEKRAKSGRKFYNLEVI